MEWTNDGGTQPVAWGYVPVHSFSLCVFYKTLAVGKDTYEIPLNKKKNKINKASYIWLYIFHEISEEANYENWNNFSIAILYL